MASGKKDYFRHSMHARNDDKIQDIMDKFGVAGYFYWFALVEICATQAADSDTEKFIFHQRTLIKELRCHKNKLRVLLEYFENTSLILVEYTENRVEVCIPKLRKYLGRYESKLETKAPKEGKEKKRKEKERKEKGRTPSPSKKTVYIKISRLEEKLPSLKAYSYPTALLCEHKRMESYIYDYGAKHVCEQIEKMHDYIESTGKKYKCYVSAMRQWSRRDGAIRIDKERGFVEQFRDYLTPYEASNG